MYCAVCLWKLNPIASSRYHSTPEHFRSVRLLSSSSCTKYVLRTPPNAEYEDNNNNGRVSWSITSQSCIIIWNNIWKTQFFLLGNRFLRVISELELLLCRLVWWLKPTSACIHFALPRFGILLISINCLLRSAEVLRQQISETMRNVLTYAHGKHKAITWYLSRDSQPEHRDDAKEEEEEIKMGKYE